MIEAVLVKLACSDIAVDQTSLEIYDSTTVALACRGSGGPSRFFMNPLRITDCNGTFRTLV